MEAMYSSEAVDDLQKHKCCVGVLSEVSGQFGLSVEIHESKFIVVEFTSILVFEGTY
jgi:hypothetical protein